MRISCMCSTFLGMHMAVACCHMEVIGGPCRALHIISTTMPGQWPHNAHAVCAPNARGGCATCRPAVGSSAATQRRRARSSCQALCRTMLPLPLPLPLALLLLAGGFAGEVTPPMLEDDAQPPMLLVIQIGIAPSQMG